MDKILNVVVSTHDPVNPIKGGGGRRTLQVAHEFKKQGKNVFVVAPSAESKIVDGINFHDIRGPSKQRSQILSSLKFNFRLLLKFIVLIRKIDLFFVHNTIAAATLPFLKKFFKFKFVLDITDIHAEYLSVGKRTFCEDILTPFLINYEYFIIRSADLIVVATKAMERLLLSKGIDGGRIKIIYDGIDIENITQIKEKSARSGIIHLGAIDRQHGVDIIIKAIPIVIAKNPGVIFYFIGGGRELLNIRELAENLKVSEHCIFTDWLTQQESRKFLGKCSIGLMPRPDVLPNRIVTTLKIYDYWASATAVISTLLEGIEEVATKGEDIIFFNSDDEVSLAHKIKQLLDNDNLREKIVHNAFERVKNFGIAECALKIVNFSLS